MLQMDPNSSAYLRAAASVQKLLQPSEMGEIFKVIAFGKGIDAVLPGMGRGDRSRAL
jgi:SAM-dependent MidA family methyltransferase